MNTVNIARYESPYNTGYWMMLLFSIFLSVYLAIVLGAITTGVLLREYVRNTIQENQAQQKSNPR